MSNMYALKVKSPKKFDSQGDERLKSELIIPGDELVVRAGVGVSRPYAYREYLGVVRESPVARYQYVMNTVNEQGREFTLPLTFDEDGWLVNDDGKRYGYALEARLHAQFAARVIKVKPRSEGTMNYINPLVPSGGTF